MCSHPKHTHTSGKRGAGPAQGSSQWKTFPEAVPPNDIQVFFHKLCLCGRVLSVMD